MPLPDEHDTRSPVLDTKKFILEPLSHDHKLLATVAIIFRMYHTTARPKKNPARNLTSSNITHLSAIGPYVLPVTRAANGHLSEWEPSVRSLLKNEFLGEEARQLVYRTADFLLSFRQKTSNAHVQVLRYSMIGTIKKLSADNFPSQELQNSSQVQKHAKGNALILAKFLNRPIVKLVRHDTLHRLTPWPPIYSPLAEDVLFNPMVGCVWKRGEKHWCPPKHVVEKRVWLLKISAITHPSGKPCNTRKNSVGLHQHLGTGPFSRFRVRPRILNHPPDDYLFLRDASKLFQVHTVLRRLDSAVS